MGIVRTILGRAGAVLAPGSKAPHDVPPSPVPDIPESAAAAAAPVVWQADPRVPDWFDAAWYLAANADVSSLNLDPIDHYVGHGRGEGRPPNAALARLGRFAINPPIRQNEDEIARQVGLVERSNIFDADWYAGEYRVPAALAIRHYVIVGAFKGHDPSPFFSSLGYLAVNRDTAAAGLNPLVHYVEHGYGEGRGTGSGTAFDGRLTARVWQNGL